MPARVHFFWTGPDFAYADFLAVRTAQAVHRPDAVWVWTGVAPQNNPHWENLLRLDQVEIKPITPHLIPGTNRFILSDYVRYRVLYLHGGLYLDFDTISLKPLVRKPERSVLAGEESPGILNIAVLDVAAGSVVLQNLLEACQQRLAAIRDVDRPFNMLGPGLFTSACRAHPEEMDIMPPEVFYPIHWKNWQLVWANCILPDTTRILHYWGSYGHDRASRVLPGQREKTTYHHAVSSVLGDDW